MPRFILCFLFSVLVLPAAESSTHVYKKAGDRELKLTIVNPPDWKASDQRPAMVFFHGGGWVGGGPTQFTQHSEYLATRGMVCIQVEYRLIKKAMQDRPLTVCMMRNRAMRWVRGHATELGVDPNHIGAGGGSAGGHLAAFVGMVEGLDDPQDDVKISPKANALALFNPVFDNGPDQGWGYARVGEHFKEYSPAHNISADDPPAIIFLGTQDKLIPVAVVERFKAGMEKAGVRCEAVFYEGQGHGFFNPGKGGKMQFYYETLLATDKFLTSLGWLKGEPTLAKPGRP